MRLIAALTLLLAIPVLGILASWLAFDAQSGSVLVHQASTVLPGYAATSLWLVLAVGIGVALVGAATAAAVSLFDFPGRRIFEWALLLPLAMPAYVLAYAYTDFLQFSGPLQTWIRALTGMQGRVLPEIRSLGGAIFLFTFCLYPYVYLLTRAALTERGVQLMEAARLLGASTSRRVREIALPMARPAIAAGVALALMETLADYGAASYFGLTTFTTGIYRAWLSMGDRTAAAQLASILLVVVALLLWLERRSQQRMRYALARPGTGHGAEVRPVPLRGGRAALAWTLCAVPILLGFVVPVMVLLKLLFDQVQVADLPWERFSQWSWNSFRLSGIAALLATALALALAFAARVHRGTGQGLVLRGALRVASLGYAVPGAVIAVGILLPTGWLQQSFPGLGVSALVTGTVFGVVYAYLVRFSAVALQSVEAGYTRIPASFDETARTLGVSRVRLFQQVHLPLLRRATLAAALLVFVDVMKELPATLVLRPFDSDTLAVIAYNFARDERLGEAALPSLAIVLVGLLPVIWLSRALRQPR